MSTTPAARPDLDIALTYDCPARLADITPGVSLVVTAGYSGERDYWVFKVAGDSMLLRHRRLQS